MINKEYQKIISYETKFNKMVENKVKYNLNDFNILNAR